MLHVIWRKDPLCSSQLVDMSLFWGVEWYSNKSKWQVCDCDVREYPDVVSLSNGSLAVSKCSLAIFDICDSRDLKQGSATIVRDSLYEVKPYTIPETSDLFNLELCSKVNIREHSIAFLKFFDDIIVLLQQVNMLLASFLERWVRFG
jgi:hypothetical protein